MPKISFKVKDQYSLMLTPVGAASLCAKNLSFTKVHVYTTIMSNICMSNFAVCMQFYLTVGKTVCASVGERVLGSV